MGLKLPKNQKLGFYVVDKPIKQYTQEELKKMISKSFKRIREGYVPTIRIHRMSNHDDR